MEHHFRHTVVQGSHIQDDLRQYLQHYLRYVPHARQLVNQYRDAEMRRMSMTPTTRVPSIVAYPVNLNVSLPGAQGLRVNIVHRMFGDNEIEELYPHYHLYPHVVSLNRGDPPEPPPRQPSPLVRPITEDKIVELLNRDIISLSQKVRILASTSMFLVVLSKHSQVANATNMAVANNDICSVCLSEVEISSVLRRLRCDHTFHQDCIDRWLLIYLTCPLCRRGIMGNTFEVNETLVDEEDFEPFEVHHDDASDDGQDDDIEAVPLLIRRRVVTPPPLSSPTPSPRYFQPLPGPHVDMDGTRFYLNPDEEAAGPSHTERRGSGFPSATASYVDLAKPGPSNFNPNPLRNSQHLSPNLSPSFSSDDEDDDISTGIPSPPQEQDWNKRKRLTLLIKKKETDSCQDDSDDEAYTAQVFENEIPITDDDERPSQSPVQTEDEDDVQLIEPTPPPLIEIDDDDDVDKERLPHGDKRKWDAAMGYDQSSSGGASYRNDDDNSSGESSKRRAYEWDDDMTWPSPSPTPTFFRNYSPFSTSSVYRESAPSYSPAETYMQSEHVSPVPFYQTDDFFNRPTNDFYDFDQGNGSNNSVNSSSEREAALSKVKCDTEDTKPNLLQAADPSLAKTESLSTNIGPLDNQGQSFYCFEPLPKKLERSLGGSGVESECGSQDLNFSNDQLTSSQSVSDGKQSVIVVLDSDDEENNNSQKSLAGLSDSTTVFLSQNGPKPKRSDEVIVISDDED